MAFTKEDLIKLEKCIASGQRRVVYSDGKTIEYADIPDMIRARAIIAKELKTPEKRILNPVFDRGL